MTTGRIGNPGMVIFLTISNMKHHGTSYLCPCVCSMSCLSSAHCKFVSALTFKTIYSAILVWEHNWCAYKFRRLVTFCATTNNTVQFCTIKNLAPHPWTSPLCIYFSRREAHTSDTHHAKCIFVIARHKCTRFFKQNDQVVKQSFSLHEDQHLVSISQTMSKNGLDHS